MIPKAQWGLCTLPVTSRVTSCVISPVLICKMGQPEFLSSMLLKGLK